jgi:formylglycine-generating enzyme required for sulfatase activity
MNDMVRMPAVRAKVGIGTDEITYLLKDYAGYGPERYAPESPVRTVHCNAFDIDVFPVINRDYALAVDAGIVAAPVLWKHPRWSPEPSAPVVGVSYFEAARYAKWLGKRLPTAVEWELAATWDPSTGQKTRYPWGDLWDDTRCLNAEGLLRRRIEGWRDWQAAFWDAGVWLRRGGVEPIGLRTGDESPICCRMMAGHVWEWVADIGSVTLAPSDRGRLKGGSWVDDRNSCRGSYSTRSPRSAWLYGPSDVGFRCARSLYR